MISKHVPADPFFPTSSGGDWTGFYAGSYTLLIRARNGSLPLNEALNEVSRLHRSNPAGEAHWEFAAVGLLHLFDREEKLPDAVRTWLEQVRGFFQTRPSANNWRLMQKVVERRLAGQRLHYDDAAACGLGPGEGGLLRDGPDGASSQYHAYNLLLLLRFGDRRAAGLTRVVAKGFEWLKRADEDWGDPNPLGRGRFQLFGYASMAAAGDLASQWGVEVDRNWRRRVQARLSVEPTPGSLSALWSGPHRPALLNGYNTAGDYAAFAHLWGVPVGSPESRIPFNIKGGVWLHFLDHQGGLLVAGRHGPLAAFLPWPAAGFDPPPRRLLIREMLRNLRKHQKPNYSLSPRWLTREQPATLGRGWRLRVSGRELVFESDRAESPDNETAACPSLWSPESGRISCQTDPNVEVENLSWSVGRESGGGTVWRGLRVRRARRGAITCRICPA